MEDVKTFAEKLQEVPKEMESSTASLKIELKVVENEYHDQPNFGFGEDSLSKEKSQGWEIERWVSGRC